jgi:ribose-phosphate pyrophosphokinase
MAEADEGIFIVSGSASRKLTENICRHLGVTPAKGETVRFSEGTLFVRVLETVRGRRVYIIQSTAHPANDNFMELLFWIDALKRAGASSVTVVMPYFSYAKGDKKDEPRVSIRGRVCADAIEAAGADRVIAMDLHAQQVQGFFRIPVDNLYALPVICERVRQEKLKNLVVVSPDVGFAKMAKWYASCLEAPLAVSYKERVDHNETPGVFEVVGDVSGKTALVVDDFTTSCGTLVEAAVKLTERGAKGVYAAVSHGLFGAKGSMEKLDQSPIKKLFITDTVEGQPAAFSKKVEVLSVAPLFAEAIRRMHSNESVSSMFPH